MFLFLFLPRRLFNRPITCYEDSHFYVEENQSFQDHFLELETSFKRSTLNATIIIHEYWVTSVNYVKIDVQDVLFICFKLFIETEKVWLKSSKKFAKVRKTLANLKLFSQKNVLSTRALIFSYIFILSFQKEAGHMKANIYKWCWGACSSS